MANFYNRTTGQFLHSFDSSRVARRTTQMRQKRGPDGKDLLDGQGNPTGEQEMEPEKEGTGAIFMMAGTTKIGNTDVTISDLMMNPDVSEVWATSRDDDFDVKLKQLAGKGRKPI